MQNIDPEQKKRVTQTRIDFIRTFNLKQITLTRSKPSFWKRSRSGAVDQFIKWKAGQNGERVNEAKDLSRGRILGTSGTALWFVRNKVLLADRRSRGIVSQGPMSNYRKSNTSA